MKAETATEIAALVEEYAAWLKETLAEIRRDCSHDEAEHYAEGITQVLEHLQEDILARIYHEHPSLRRTREP